MNKKIEERFIKEYFIKSRRERILYELSNKKKRMDCIWNFSFWVGYLQKNKIYYKGNKKNVVDIEEWIKGKTSEERCYIISSDEEIDGKILKVDEALQRTIGFGMPSILIFSDIAIIETEREDYGAAIKYLLEKK